MSDDDRPTGTVTFLFSDIEGSTELAARAGPDRYRAVLEQHQRVLRAAFTSHDGIERSTEGDSFFVVFRQAPSAVAAAVQAQRALSAEAWPDGEEVCVRMGIHTGVGIAGGDDYVGIDVNRAARIAAAAHGGQVLVSDATRSLSVAALPDGVSLRDLGKHRFKNIPESEHVFQLTIAGLPSDFGPIRSLDVPLTNLPVRSSTFIGRERERQLVTTMLGDGRLVTLLGPGGTGKSALATEVARALGPSFEDGAWFVALDAVADPQLVGSAIVAALGLRDVSGRSAREQLLDNLPGRSLLLVLDNFEQVIDAATLIADLLAAAPRLKVIVTSRAPLRLAAEQVCPLAPLAVPSGNSEDLTELAATASVALFIDRARQTQPDFVVTSENADAVAEICRRLDGLPLAIELAAARLTMLGPLGIRDRLVARVGLGGTGPRDAPRRQRTLEGAIGWSHDLLDKGAQELFAQVAVFSGGWRLEQAEAVCASGTVPREDVAEVLASLVDQSLVTATPRSGGVRFGLLETVREFASERLAAMDVAHSRQMHAHEYLRLAEEVAPRLETPESPAAMSRLQEERDNLRSAVQYAVDTGDGQLGLRLGMALGTFWVVTAEIDEASRIMGVLLALEGAKEPTSLRVRVLQAAGNLAYYSGDLARTQQLYEEQLDLARAIADAPGIADARYNLLFTDAAPDDERAVLAELDEIEAAYRAAGNLRGCARSLWVRGGQLLKVGRADEAVRVLEEAVGRYRELGDYSYLPQAAGMLSMANLQVGDRFAAAHWLLQSLSAAHALGNFPLITAGMPTIAMTAFHLGMPEDAAVLLGAYDGLSRRYGVRMPVNLARSLEATDPLTQVQAALDRRVFEGAKARGAAMSIDDVMEFVDEVASKAQAGPPPS